MVEDATGTQRRKAIERLPGTPYRLLKKLGEGSSAVVYRAQHAQSGAVVAIKVMRYRRDSAPQLADRMRLEAEVLGQLRHRNLTRFIDYGTSD
ncbi:MAG TPA: hypothetical protein ENK23_08145, partial [Sorangium sp.]|nr:hypothetical protein [Sorangium sp.]